MPTSPGPDDRLAPWASLGPANVGGRTLCLAIDPANPNVLYAGSASGGLWKSTTGGVGADAWDYVDTGFPVLGVGAIAIDPTDPDVLYIGTGEAYDQDESIGGKVVRTTRGSYGIGILKSTDGGATWTKSPDWTYEQSRGVWRIEIDPTSHNVLYAATTEGVYKSPDAGASWALVNPVIMAMDVRVNPVNPAIVFAAHGNFESTGVGIYRSTDHGANWTRLSAGLPATWTGKAGLAITPGAPNIVYASIADTLVGRGLYKSIDGGDTWAQVNATDYPQFQGWYSHYVVVSPFDPQTLFTGGVEIWRSTDGGANLQVRSRWQGVFFGVSPPEGPIGASDYAHSDHHFAVWHPTDPNTVFFASDGGIFKTTNLGGTFVSLIGGYQSSQFYNGFANSGADPDLAMGGLQDNFPVIYEGTAAWRRVIGGDGTWTSIDPGDPSTRFASIQNLGIYRTRDGGAHWTSLPPPQAADDVTAFVAPHVLAPSQPAVLYGGRSRVYRTTNGASSWTATNGGQPLSAGNPVLAMAISKTSAAVVYAATAPIASRARLFRTRDSGATWTDVTGVLPDRYPGDLAVDPGDDRKVFATFMGFGMSHVFKSTDGGDTWIDIGAGLPDIPVSAVEVDPYHPEVIYAGTDLGVFISPNGGASWLPFGTGMPQAVVGDLKAFAPTRMLRVATHGNGAYERPLFEPCADGDSDLDGVCNTVDCAPANGTTWLPPDEVTGLLLTQAPGGGLTTLTWSALAQPGTGSIVYDTVSSRDPADFLADPSVTCIESNGGGDTTATDAAVPAPGAVIYYLVRAENACGAGTAGAGTQGSPRPIVDCP
ncbi:MAG TPA: hypothetical protein VJV75_03135 [Candidatus Polarisedimenticolia bacterium]|nr:hypothetical protein [Candidatus Polarisedimenticolia bacterium]